MEIEAIVTPPNQPDLKIIKLGNSEREIELIKKTANLFNTKANLNAYHYLIADKDDFVGVVEFTFRNDSKNGTAIISGMWINKQFILSFMTMIYLNLGLNYDRVNYKNNGSEVTFIHNADGVSDVNPMNASGLRIIDFDSYPKEKLKKFFSVFNG